MITQFPDLSTIPVIAPTKPRPLLIPHDTLPNHYILQIDNTTLETYQTCPRSAYHYCIDRKQKSSRAPLIFGGALHEALDHLYSTSFTDDNLVLAQQKILTHFSSNQYEASDFNWRTPSFALEVIAQYFNHYILSDALVPKSHHHSNILFVEKPFALNIGSFNINATTPFPASTLLQNDDPSPLYIDTLHVQWTGKIDIAAILNNSPVIVDHKTTSVGGTTFYQEFELSQQTHGYCFALSQLLNRPVTSFYLNALIIRKPTKTGRSIEFDRRQYFYSQSQIDEWRIDVLAAVESFVHSLLHNSFPKYTKWCVGKYGLCQYFPVCSTPPNNRHLALASSDFSNVTWSPLAGSAQPS
jgi:hypothetical protein